MFTKIVNIKRDAYRAISSLGESYERNLDSLMTEIASESEIGESEYDIMNLGDEKFYTVMLTPKYKVLFKVKTNTVDVFHIINHEAMQNYYAKVG